MTSRQSIRMPLDDAGHAINRSMGVPLEEDAMKLGDATHWVDIFDLNDAQYERRVFHGLSCENPHATIRVQIGFASSNEDGSVNEVLHAITVSGAKDIAFDDLLFGPGVNDINGRRFTRVMARLKTATGTADAQTFTYSGQPSPGSSILLGGIEYAFREVADESIDSADYNVVIAATEDLTWAAFLAVVNAKDNRVTVSQVTGTNTMTVTSNYGSDYFSGGAGFALVKGTVDPNVTLAGASLAGGAGTVVTPVFHIW